jgi:hypothetical protein
MQSLDFLLDDSRSLFELFVHIIGTIPAILIAAATFPLVFSLLVIHVYEQVLRTAAWRCLRVMYQAGQRLDRTRFWFLRVFVFFVILVRFVEF